MKFDDTKAGIERCESPLEEKLAHAFASLSRFEWRNPDDHFWEVGRWPGWFLALLAQPEYGPYRADFGISPYDFDEDGSPAFIVVIEVDGHDYHERTKEQAEYDKSRDRFMTATNVKVLRFTGREVYLDAEACALEVLTYVFSLQRDHLTEEWKKFVIQRQKELEECKKE